ncbi:MAG: hypothetical protein KH268_13635 [Clostridiales bacterium]|nr:hypothetical protein [Clostridiales bacterium]
MGYRRRDAVLKEFWRSNERFADLFNTVLFGGEEIICPCDLQEMDTDVSGVIEMKDYREVLHRTRDVIKKMAYGIEFVVMGIELQNHIHYAMPLRHMIYDGMSYLKEYKEIVQQNKKEKRQASGDEFLSGIRKEDRLHPVISLTIYYGENPWDGPLSLKDMLQNVPLEVMGAVSDYKMNLLEIRGSGQYHFNNPDVQAVFEILRAAYEDRADEVQKRYGSQKLSTEVMAVVGEIVHCEELMRINENEEVDGMYTFFHRLVDEGKDEGRSEEKNDIIIRMLQNSVSEQDIILYTGATEDEIRKAREELKEKVPMELP